MKTFKVVGMNTDKIDGVLGISTISKTAFKHLERKDKHIIGYVAREERNKRKGNAIENTDIIIGELEVSGKNVKIYEGNPNSFLEYGTHG